MKSLLKFITCGSVDDGKSTLIGHMLYDAKLIFADQENALKLDSVVGSADGHIDYSLLLDGLMAEREQGITIDVSYRFFNTENRSFIVADCPGHEQYTKNMAVGASFADLAVILVDASKGVLTQTMRHTRICAMMGIKNFVVAVNKMDLIGYDQYKFENIKSKFTALSHEIDCDSIHIVPVSATEGDNLTKPSANTPWYKKDSLLTILEKINISEHDDYDKFIMPVQRVCRPNHNFRGFQGEIERGSVKVGDTIKVLPNNETAKIKSILSGFEEVNEAFSGQPITLMLDKEIDVSRGCVIVNNIDLIVSDMFVADILWMDNTPLVEGRNYIIKCGTMMLPATIMKIKDKKNINTNESIPADRLAKNELGTLEICTSQEFVFDQFKNNKVMGEFILIDRVTNATSACGTIINSLERANNLYWQKTDITPELRANQKMQKAKALWFTGLSGSGKSTLANEIEKRLFAQGKHTMLLDGDNVRHGLNKDLGFNENDRVENIRRISQVAKLMCDAGMICITSFISPYETDRENARSIIGADRFIEIYVSTPIEVCEERDVKGLYKRARTGEIKHFTGVTSPYEVPPNPDITIDTSTCTLDEAATMVMNQIDKLLNE